MKVSVELKAGISLTYEVDGGGVSHYRGVLLQSINTHGPVRRRWWQPPLERIPLPWVRRVLVDGKPYFEWPGEAEELRLLQMSTEEWQEHLRTAA